MPEKPAAARHPTAMRHAAFPLTVAALGVVFGDIGTSPLYSMQTVFALDGGIVKPTPGDVYGIVSMVFWAIAIVVTAKYVATMMRADNDGEGGVMALAALARRTLTEGKATTGHVRGMRTRRAAFVLALGIAGAALFYGDSVITPAISVLSAIEGLEVSSPHLADAIVPIAVVVLAALFGIQRWGTGRVGGLFGPVMALWFVAIAAAGLGQVVRHPGIIAGLSPTYAIAFIVGQPGVAFIACGAVVLAITGAEALYADMGHFGRSPIRRAWFFIAFPALTLNYLGQGAVIVADPAARANPFFLLLPGWAQFPMVVLAAVATLIASQAVISGAFSVSRQAIRLGVMPHLRMMHTSPNEIGQIYVPAVNWTLMVIVLALTVGFRSSNRLATAYGIAVTGTFVITTALFLVVAHLRWHWGPARLIAVGVVFGGVELGFFAANIVKVDHGGWIPLVIAAVTFTVMMTWQRGRKLVTARRRLKEGSLKQFLGDMDRRHVPRVDGTVVFPHPDRATTPLAFRTNVEFNGVRHRRIVIMTAETLPVPHVPTRDRLTVDTLAEIRDDISYVRAQFGFQDVPNLPAALRLACDRGLLPGVNPATVTYAISRITLVRGSAPGMSGWRKRLFLALAHNTNSYAVDMRLPGDRTVVMGATIPV